MPLDLQQFGSKLRRYRNQLELSLEEVSSGTGIAPEHLQSLESGTIMPTGDEVLIFADFYKCDYHFFVSNERHATFEQTENLYRRYGREFSKADRWRVQEFLFLCECEEILLTELGRPKKEFASKISGTYFKKHAEDGALQLRKYFGYSDESVPLNVYSDFRKIGIHVFRRRLENSNISGMTVRHPVAGPCVLVNYTEDVYRQRFTAAHEAAHALFDREEIVVSFSEWEKENLVEIRANTFASRYLLPPAVLKKVPVIRWNDAEIVRWAMKFKVSTSALVFALKELEIIDEAQSRELMQVRVSQDFKVDPELEGLTARSLERKRALLERGLSHFYVSLCFEGIGESVISNARAAEMLMVGEDELGELAELFQVKMALHG